MTRYILVTLVIIIAGCTSTDDRGVPLNLCGEPGSVESKPWMESLKSSMTNCSCVQTIFSAYYHDQTVFFVLQNDPLCNGVFGTVLYNCQGEPIKTFTNFTEDKDEFYADVLDKEAIYSCTKN